MFGFEVEPQPPSTSSTRPTAVAFGSYRVTIRHTPGHCPGGVCLAVEGADDGEPSGRLFVGDTLFAGSIGRTDLPGGDARTLLRRSRGAVRFPDETPVYSGHGEPTTIGKEKADESVSER